MKDGQTTAIDSYETCTCNFNGFHETCGTFGFEMPAQRHWHWSRYSVQSFSALTSNSDCLQAPSPKQFPGLVVSLCILVFWIYHTHPHQSKALPEHFWKSNTSKKIKRNSWRCLMTHTIEMKILPLHLFRLGTAIAFKPCLCWALNSLPCQQPWNGQMIRQACLMCPRPGFLMGCRPG